MEVDRRAAFGQIAVGAAVVAGVPQIAAADGTTCAWISSIATFTGGDGGALRVEGGGEKQYESEQGRKNGSHGWPW